MTDQQPKIPAAQIIHVLIQGMPKNPGERMLWEGMTREDIARRLSAAKAGSHKAATVRSKIRKMARAGNVEVCGCGEHVRPTQSGVDMATDWFRTQSPIGNPITAAVE